MKDRPAIAVLGLGLMGTAITHRLLQSGFAVAVWNRTREKAIPLVHAGAVWSDDPLAACPRAILCLYDSAAVASVVARFSADLSPGKVLIDTTTGEPADAQQMAQMLQQRGVTYLDAPISGSSEQLRAGEATVMVGGDQAAFEACQDLWPVLGGKVFHVGPSGSASKVKLVTNLVLGLNRAALAEGLVYAQSLGLDVQAALRVLQNSAAYSKTMDTKGQKMLSGDFRPQARLAQHLKDVRLILQTAAESGLDLQLSRTHAQLLERAVSAGLGEEDNSAIIRVYEKPAT